LLLNRDPIGVMLSRLNQFLLDRTGGERYATLFFAVLRPDGQMEFANAGHCPPLLIRSSGAARQLTATATPVGLIDGAAFAVEQLHLHAGDKLVLYSDGFAENLTPACVAGLETLPAESLHAALAGQAQEAPEDDQTLLVIEYLAAGNRR